jgi:hypothetical protein
MDGTHLFGKLAAWTQWLALSHAGWQQWPATVLSACTIVLGLAFWWLQLRRLGFSTRFISCFLAVAGVSEPFVAAASRFRYEFLTFTLVSAGLLLVACGRPFLGAFLAALAIESEPMAVAGLIPIVVLACHVDKLNSRLILRLSAGVALAAACYFALHSGSLHAGSAGATPIPGPSLGLNGFFRDYFITRLRHRPELVCFVLAGAVYWRRRRAIGSHYPGHYFGIGALLLTIFSAIVPHGNPAYIIFAYPFLVAAALTAFDAERRPWLIAGCAMLLFLPQQIYLLYLTRGQGYRAAEIAQVSQAIAHAAQQLNLPDDRLRIYGDYRLWYAHPHFYRGAAEVTRGSVHDADLYLCFDAPPGPAELEARFVFYCPDLKAMVPLRPLGSVELHRRTLFLYAPR